MKVTVSIGEPRSVGVARPEDSRHRSLNLGPGPLTRWSDHTTRRCGLSKAEFKFVRSHPALTDSELGRRFAAALLPRLFGTNPRSHHKGATGRVRTGDQRLPVLCHCQLGVLDKYNVMLRLSSIKTASASACCRSASSFQVQVVHLRQSRASVSVGDSEGRCCGDVDWAPVGPGGHGPVTPV